MPRKHVYIASGIVVVLTVFSVIIAGDTDETLLPPAQAASQQKATNEVLGEFEQRSTEEAVDDGSSTNNGEPSSNQEGESEQKQAPETAQEINDALNNLDLGGWEDDLLSDEELEIDP